MLRNTITQEHIEKSYEVAKQVLAKKITRQEGIKELEKNGMNKSSAGIHIYVYLHLIKGKDFSRGLSIAAFEYYLKSIHAEESADVFKNALWVLKQYIDHSPKPNVTLREIYKRYTAKAKSTDRFIYSNKINYPDELDETDNKEKYTEGATKRVVVNSYERNPQARAACIRSFDYNCQACGFNFEQKYGDLGAGFIHVHHVKDLATIKAEYEVDPINDLIPVCPNCHAMLHRRKPALSINELKDIMRKNNDIDYPRQNDH